METSPMLDHKSGILLAKSNNWLWTARAALFLTGSAVLDMVDRIFRTMASSSLAWFNWS